MAEAIKIPQVIEGGIPSYESMWGNAVVPVAKSIITSYATNMMRQYLYGSRLAESRDLAADLADITSFARAAPQWRDPDKLRFSMDELERVAEVYGDSEQWIRQKYALANLRLMEPYYDTLVQQKKVRGIRDEMEDVLGDLVKGEENWVGEDPEALKVLDAFENRLSDLEQYQSVEVRRDVDDMSEDASLTMSAYNMLTSLDDDQLLDGTQIDIKSFPTPAIYDNAVEIKDKIYSSLAGGKVSKQGIRDATALMGKLRTNMNVANNAELRAQATARAQMATNLGNMLKVNDLSMSMSDDKMIEFFGSDLGGDDPVKGLITNFKGLIGGRTEITPKNLALVNNIALREMAKIVLAADDVPKSIYDAAYVWRKDGGLSEHNHIMAGNFYKQIAHWEKDILGMSTAAEGWNEEYIVDKMSGRFWESAADVNVKNVAIRWNNFLKEMYKMRIEASQLFPGEVGWLEGIGTQNIQPTYGSALEQELELIK